jgi:SNF2 family DNA or RNA helicase
MENRLGELWSVMHLVVPGLLGSAEKFRNRFARPIEADRDQAAAEALRQRIRPFILRRTKEQVLTELPAKTEIVRHVEPSADERQLVDAERSRALAELDAGQGKDARGSQRMAILAALTRLRQLACAPQLVVKDSPIPSTKIAALTELVGELRAEGHRLLIFSQFTSFLDLVESAWKDSGLRWLRLDGSTPAPARRNLVARFQDGESDAFLLSLKAGGTGLNLTAASYVIHLDPWWNPATEDQASDRAHRMGQEKPVTIIRLVSAGSVEEKILALHAEKRDLIDAVLAGSDAAASLSETELLGILRVG